MFDDHQFAYLGLCKALFIDFVWELKWSKSFVVSNLASLFFVFGYQVDALERAVEGLWNWPIVMEQERLHWFEWETTEFGD